MFASRHFRFLPDPRAPGGQRRSSHSHTGNPGNRGYAFWQEHIATSPRNASQACSMSATPSSAGTSLASALLQTLSSIHREVLRHAVAANAYAFVLVTTPTRSQHHTAHPGPLPLSSKIIDHHHRLQRRSRSPVEADLREDVKMALGEQWNLIPSSGLGSSCRVCWLERARFK